MYTGEGVATVTLAELRAAHPTLFYGQTWYEREPFIDREGVPFDCPLFAISARVGGQTIHAADLAATYVLRPDLALWRLFIWTDDVDTHGNRIYVAGVGQYGCEGFQIHRALNPQAWWVMT